jgi:hypothetical protein
MRTHLSMLLAAALGLVGCGPAPIELISSPAVPGATGEITTSDEGDNGNLKLKVEVKHLAPPEKVERGSRVYVVWVEREGATPQNMGALRVDKDLTGSLDTVTPFHRFNLVITAEEDPATVLPKGPRVLSAAVER